MRGREEIEDRIKFLEKKLETEKKLYSAMNQIDMLSASGSVALKVINKTKGNIAALKWVLRED